MDLDLDFGHGFVPRIGESNYKAVDNCVGPAQLFQPDPLQLPWALVDAAWAAAKPSLLDTLRWHGARVLFDTQGWRYRYGPAWGVAKLREASWAPAGPVDVERELEIHAHVTKSVSAQGALGADAYLVPGWQPDSRDEDLTAAYEQIIQTATSLNDVPPRPLVLYVGGHTQGLDQVHALIERVPLSFSGLYIQLTPIAPVTDGASKLEDLTAVYQHAAGRGFTVVAGHGGASVGVLRAMGVDAADAGLASSETFDAGRGRRTPSESGGDEANRGGGPASRMYLDEIGRSASALQIRRMLAVPGAAAEIRGCRRPCHRFLGGDMLDRAREHSLWARVGEAAEVSDLPLAMRLSAIYERTCKQRSVLVTINSALEAAGEETLNPKPLDSRLAWISRTAASRAVA